MNTQPSSCFHNVRNEGIEPDMPPKRFFAMQKY